MRIRRVPGSIHTQTLALIIVFIFNGTPSRGQFVRVNNRVCMQFVGELDSSLRVKTQVGKMTEGVRNIDGPTYTKKDSVKVDTTPLQLFLEGTVLLLGGLELVTRPGIFAIFNYY